MARHGLSPKKSLGQNFLTDPNLTGKIARAAGPLDGKTIIEVGPGPGGLTRSLLAEGAGNVIVIERDRRCLPILEELAQAFPGKLDIHMADALKADYAALAPAGAKLVANLPYNIATPLVVLWLTAEPWPPWYSSMTLMFQREVADRLAARPGAKSYGRLSVLAQWRTYVKKLFDIGPRAFVPPPKVTSSVVQFVPRDKLLDAGPPGMLEKTVKAAFAQRRKMLRSSLKSLIPDPRSVLAQADIADRLRAEDLTVEQFCILARAIAGRAK
jgi:16S rRNA (adenine1518-N6/adenine1519-N6)-dimethyltransferase